MVYSLIQIFLLALGFMQQPPASKSAPPQTAPAASPKEKFCVGGTLVNAVTGLPISQADVGMSANEPNSVLATRSGDDGKFLFEDVAPGKYMLFARHRGYRRQNYQQHENFSTAIVVGPGLDTEHLRFTLPPTSSISGNVTDEMNDPVRAAQVLLFQQNVMRGRRAIRLQQRATTDDEGHYHFGHLEPGNYFVAVAAKPWYAAYVAPPHFTLKLAASQATFTATSADQRDPALDVVYPITFFPNAADLAGAAPLTVRPGSEETADFRLLPVPALHVLVQTPVTDENQNASVQVTQPLGGNLQEFVQVNTEVVEPGLMEVSGLPPGRFNISVTTTKGSDSLVHAQTMDLSGDTQLDALHSIVYPVVSGVVKMDDGSELAQPASVQLRNVETDSFVGVQSGPGGEFSFKMNPTLPGTYEIIVFEQVGTVVRSVSATGAKVTGHNLQISGSEEVRVTVVVTKGSGQVTGTVLKDAKPVGGAMVILVPQDPENNLAVFRRDQSDSDGSFSLNTIPPGTYTVLAIENGWDLEWAKPGVLQKYLPGGEIVQVGSSKKIVINLKVQQQIGACRMSAVGPALLHPQSVWNVQVAC
jgi:hypothetical protein